ncbi:MAG: glycosyltransferase family 4 protein [Chloroflexota bacterium]|nr:glycosyltransferase family 4 protein [Chloroflexota bacterium]
MSRKPRVAILHYAAPPTIGGVETTIAAHARRFADHGYAVKVIAGRGKVFDPRVPVEIISLADSKSPRVLEVNAELARGIVSKKFHVLTNDLTRNLTRSLAKCDVLIAHNTLSLHKNLALTVALKNLADAHKIKIIAWCHDFAWSDPQYGSDVHPGAPWEWLRQPWAGVKYVVVSESRKDELRKLWGTDGAIAVVPPGMDAGDFLGITKTTARWARELALLDAAPLLLLPARLTRRKNSERAMAIAAALARQGMNAKLVVTGPPGPHNPSNAAYLEQLRARRRSLGVENAVVFLHEFGAVRAAVLRDLYLLADALLFPSEREGFGIPLLEAGLAHLPIFCADPPPFRETAREHAHYFSADESADAIAAQIATFFKNDLTYQMKRRVVLEYQWEEIFVRQIEPLL